MTRMIPTICSLASAVLLAVALPLPSAAGRVPTGKPEEAGMSTERLQRIRQAIERHIEAREISGAVTLVARRGKIVHFQAHGLMDLDTGTPMRPDAIFRLASMTKPITGRRRHDDGRGRQDPPERSSVEVHSRVQETPKLPFPAILSPRPPGQRGGEPDFYLVPAYREITVRDLLTHTSGLISGGIGAREAAKLNLKTPADTLATYVPKLGSVALDFQPGTQWAYSGAAGPEVLGRIVEIVSGEPYDQFLRTRIFEPLGMKDTFFYPPDDRRSRLVTLYDKSPNGLKKSANQDGFSSKTFFGAGGGLMSTAEDYLQFAQMLLNGGKLNGQGPAEPQDGAVDGFQSRGRDVQREARPARPRHGLWPLDGYRRRLGCVGTARSHRQFRLGWSLRNAGVDRPGGKDGYHRHDSNAGGLGAARLRERGDASHHGIVAR